MEHQSVTSNLPTEESDPFDSLFPDTLPSLLTLDSLSTLPQWVAWREVPNKAGKPQKVPFNPAHPSRGAKPNDCTTWGTRAAAERALACMPDTFGKRGVGLELGVFDTKSDLRLGGIDLDSCLDSATGEIAPWAAEVVERFASYTEVSPSGEGVKVFFTYRAIDAPALANAMRHPDTGAERHRVAWSQGTHCEIGLDVSNRYYTVTERRWAGCPEEFRTATIGNLQWLINEAGPTFLSNGQDANPGTSMRDESGSGCAFREMLRLARLDFDKVESLAAMRAAPADVAGDAGKASEWLSRTTQREINRTWERAKAFADTLRPVDAQAKFDPEPEDTAAHLADHVAARLNGRHAVVVIRGNAYVATENPDGSVDYGTERSLHLLYRNDRVPAGKDGKLVSASEHWMQSPVRRTYPGGVAFAPQGAALGKLNTWKGWAIEPDARGSCALFLRHVREVVCNGNADHAAYVIGWLAHMIQRPEEKPGVALVLKGKKGTGKDTLVEYMARILGQRHVPTVAHSEHVTGRFNARLESALLLHVQEGTWAGDRKAEGVLKFLVTSPYIEIERKGVDTFNLPSILRMFISSNEDWVVPASEDERRWAVFEVSNARRGDEPYFNALRYEMDGAGPGALLHYLRNYDLSGFNVRKAPETEGLRNQKLATLGNIEAWWFEVLNRGALLAQFDDGEAWANAGQSIGRDALRWQYTEWMKGRRFDGEPLGERAFGSRLRSMLPGLDDRRPWAKAGAQRLRHYVLPPLTECRTQFDAWIGCSFGWECSQ